MVIIEWIVLSLILKWILNRIPKYYSPEEIDRMRGITRSRKIVVSPNQLPLTAEEQRGRLIE